MRFLAAVRRYPLIGATVLVLVAVSALTLAGQHEPARWIATGYTALVIAWTLVGMVREILGHHFGLDILAVVAMGATLAVGEFIAALLIVLMLTGGEALEDFASRRAKRDLTALLDREPRIANLVEGPGEHDGGAVTEIPAADVRPGNILLVRPSELVPVDAVLLTAEAAFDESSLTGESLPATRRAGEEI